jgi:hypothetical protein
MNTYIFHRGDMWYPIELENDEIAVKNAECNPGTTKVTDINGKEIWSQKESESQQKIKP